MMETQIRITFQPTGRTVSVLRGTTILEAAARVGLVLDTPCGGGGTCGKCRVRVTLNAGEPGDADKKVFSAAALQDGWRLACRTRIEADTVVSVPASSLFGGDHQIMTSSDAASPRDVLPAVRKLYVELTPPTLNDDAPDLLRLERQTGPFRTDLSLIRHVSATLRAHDFKGTAVLADHRLLDFEPGDTRDRCFGIAFDIGTTTLVGQLLDLRDGGERGVVSRMNPQVSYGDDVLSRVGHAGSSSGCLDEMRLAVVQEIVGMIDALCAGAGIGRENIYEVTFAGNTTMEHILCGLNPAQLGRIPFVPLHARGLLVTTQELGIPIHRGAPAYLFPLIGGFVGGDTVAGMLATRIDRLPGPVLLVDIGTNGEIVLAHGGQFWAASTAAGPAFEGARISCGMRGTHGAIEKVVLNGDVRLEVIGNADPVGLCGSGLIDLMAELLQQGIVTPDGQMLPPDDLPGGLAPALAARVRRDREGGATRFVLVEASGRGGAAEVAFTQRDVREVQLGCGAIRAGIALLLRLAGLEVADLKTVLIAGGFGNFIRRSSAQRIGLLPGGIDHQRIRYVGNVSLAGARAALLSTDARALGEEMARRARHVELSTMEGFQEAFADAMMFPERPAALPPPGLLPVVGGHAD
jgi:uncharacterized 2Fe-2S/4Fe-4S cluster protein (DUF4445 family)